MPARFDQDGVRFTYPDNWDLELEKCERGWTAAVQSPDTAFVLVSYDDGMPDANEMAVAALDALREEYPGLEADEHVESLAGQPAFGHEMHFSSLDLTNTCWTGCFYGSRGTILVMWQANDLELDAKEPVLRAICSSLQVEEA